MWRGITKAFDRLDPVTNTTALRDVVVIRPAHDADIAPLHDLAELDSAAPLEGPVLVAVVEGHVWAAMGLNGGRVIADPFRPSAGAVELLHLRETQLRAARQHQLPGRASRLGTWILRGRQPASSTRSPRSTS
ncbi:MAG: hypothetical protein QOE11_1458 [Solirubrobacteraceae bacterium]|jgi:hypothetical protein|nr:hypothetical protein [Solirubrobacteraceae bacterium]